MASYVKTFEERQQELANRQSFGEGRGPEVQFLTTYLQNDGDTVVVRFPYKSMADIMYNPTHLVAFPGFQYGKRVRCEGPNCELCKQGIKVADRFFVKMLAYTADSTGNVKAVNAVWDKPAYFADTTVKNLIDEYGDLTQYLFKIRMTIDPATKKKTYSDPTVIMNTTIYSPDKYLADFTELDQVDAARLCSKSYEQYVTAINGGNKPVATKTAQPAPVQQPAYTAPATQAQPVQQAPAQFTQAAPVQNVQTPVQAQFVQPAQAQPAPFEGPYTQTPAQAPVQQEEQPARRTIKYTF